MRPTALVAYTQETHELHQNILKFMYSIHTEILERQHISTVVCTIVIKMVLKYMD